MEKHPLTQARNSAGGGHKTAARFSCHSVVPVAAYRRAGAARYTTSCPSSLLRISKISSSSPVTALM